LPVRIDLEISVSREFRGEKNGISSPSLPIQALSSFEYFSEKTLRRDHLNYGREIESSGALIKRRSMSLMVNQ
jgi:hypothetical protein